MSFYIIYIYIPIFYFSPWHSHFLQAILWNSNQRASVKTTRRGPKARALFHWQWHGESCGFHQVSVQKSDGLWLVHVRWKIQVIPHRIHVCYIWCAMDPINKKPLYVSINIPAPWILWVLINLYMVHGYTITTEPCSPEPVWNHGLFWGNHPQMAELFRLVKYYNLPIYIYMGLSWLVVGIPF